MVLTGQINVYDFESTIRILYFSTVLPVLTPQLTFTMSSLSVSGKSKPLLNCSGQVDCCIFGNSVVGLVVLETGLS